MIFYVIFNLLLSLINGCAFSSYEEALIPKDEYYQTIQQNLPSLSEGNSFSFGYWILHRSQLIFGGEQDWQTFFSIKDQEMYRFFSVQQYFVQEEKQYYIQYSFNDLDYNRIYFTMKIPFYYYSSYWIFTLFTLQDNYQTLILEMTGQEKQTFKTNAPLFQNDNTYNFYIGDNSQYKPKLFQGRLSKIVFIENYVYQEDSFENFQNICQIPEIVTGEQQVSIISGISIFQGDTFLQTSFRQFGRKYCITGWIKYITMNVFKQIQHILLRISSNENTNNNRLYGDNLFMLTSFLSKQQPQQSKLAVTIDSFCDRKSGDFTCLSEQTDIDRIYKLYFEFQNGDDTSFYEGLQQWHYFQYEYGRIISKDFKVKFELLFQIQFFNAIGYLQKSISDQIYKDSWTNDLFYVFIGEKINEYDQLQAQIFEMKFIHSYDENKEFLLICHQTCKTCKGPFLNDCLSCYDSQKRILFEETNQCLCVDGFTALEIGSLNCQPVKRFYQIVKIVIEEQSQCQQGYFSIMNNDQIQQCIQCPQQQENSYFCFDCFVGSNSWRESLVCSQDLISRGIHEEDGFILQDRSAQTIDIYFLDQQYNLIHLPGYQGYCDLTLNETNCFLISAIKNINNIDQGGFCKPNYFYYQGQCLVRDYECLQFDFKGDCIECQDNQYLRNKRCFNCPLKCLNCVYNENQQQLSCQNCQNQYALLNGECLRCGRDCLICDVEQPDKNKIFYYLKCLKCIDDQQYFISSDQINCKKNTIEDCKYMMEIKQTQNPYWFIPDFDQSNIMTACALCKTSPIYDLTTKKCINDPTTIQNNQNIQIFGCISILKNDMSEICTTLVQSQQNTFTYQCNLIIIHCVLCQLVLQKGGLVCLLCDQGYFADRLSGQCQICPSDLNCIDCGQQQRKSKDYWVYEIRPFIKVFLEKYDFSFWKTIQSQDLSDYEIFCKLCKEGYSVVDGLCIPVCPKSCLECELINMEFKCVRCLQIDNQIQLTIIDNQCIQCPFQCTLCRKRNNKEILSINPQFTDQLYILNSYQCLQSIKGQNLFYDNEIGRYIECDQYSLCSNEITINLNLICSEKEYQAQLNQLSNQNQISEFQQKNILITDLFSASSSFQQFQNNIFYLQTNQDSIKAIRIVIESSQQQVCQVRPFTKIDQTFAEHIFSLKYVELFLDFKQQVEFQLQGEIQILNFHKIIFKNIIFTSIKSNYDKLINFQSIYQQQIYLSSFQLNQQSINQVDSFFIIVSNVTRLEIYGFLIQNLFLKDKNEFFTVSQQSFIKNIIIKDVYIENCIINNLNFLNFYIGIFDTFLLDNLSVVSTFNNSKLIKINKDTYINSNIEDENIQISNIMLQLQVYNTKSLIQIESYQKVKFSNFTILNSSIVNSTIMNLNKQINLQSFNLSYSDLKLDSIIFSNVEEQDNVTLKLMNLNFETNQYDSSTHFIYISKLNTQELFIDIKNLILINNVGLYFSRSYKDFEKALIYIEAHQILIQDFILMKGYGINELFIKDGDNFTLLNSEIRQDEQFRFQGLHQNLDCVLRKLNKLTYVQAIIIYSTKNSHIKNMKISNLQLINFPIILYKSAEVEIKEQQEIFKMEEIDIENNFLLQTDSIATISIILVSSQQIMQIEFNKINFQNNLFHSFQQNHLKKSSTLFNIDSFQSQFSLNKSIIQNNLVTNSTDSIIYVNCQSIQLSQCNFKFNSIFNYQVLQPYLKWGFNDEIVYQEQIELIFPIKSESGNGLLIGQFILITETNLEKSKGSSGGAFKILGQNNCILKFQNIILKQISTIYSQQTEFGGAFNIDGSQTQTVIVEFDKIKGEDIYSKNFGGFLYLKSSDQFIHIQITNLNMRNIQSQIGSLVYLDFTSLANNFQSLIMSNITIINSYQSFERFLSYFKIFLQEDLNQIASNRTLIYSDYGTNLSFNHIDVIGLFEEGLFQINGIQSIVIQNINIINCIFQDTLIKILPFQYIQQFITIKDLYIRNITQQSYTFDYTCLQNLKEIKSNEQLCINSEITAPQNLNNFLLDFDLENKFKDCFNQLQQNDQKVVSFGLIKLTGLNNFPKINLVQLYLEQIDCENCEKGLIYIQFQTTSEQKTLQTSYFKQIKITNSKCGFGGCFNIEKQSISDSQNKRQLNTVLSNIWQSEVYIFDFVCKNNTATFGTCLSINNLKSTLYSSKLISNNAKSYGGAIYIAGKQLFVINDCQIVNNTAFTGGGLYFVDGQQTSYSNFQNQIFNNSATFFGNDYKLNSEALSLYIQNDIPLELEIVSLNSTFKIVEAGRNLQQMIKLPCGQQLNQYQYFDPQKRIYQNANIKFRIRAIQFDNSWSKQLDNTYCIVQSRQINNISDQNQFEFTNNFTNIKKVNFDSIEQEYSLENLIIYFDSNAESSIFLQLDFQCNSVFVPIYHDQFPYELINQHQNYHLRVNLQTLPCQYGEIKNITDQSCHRCDAEQGFFSLKLNQPKCEIKDEISTLSVKSALLELRPGYWRPYFDQNIITYCYNLPDNCLGGWIEGDYSCYVGHIGALCEQCDVHNSRGDGNYAMSEKFYCGSCRDQSKNITIIILTIVWTLFSLFISVQGNLKMLDEFSKPQFTYQQKLLFQLNQPKTGVLMKMLTNYFQIIASIATFQLNFSVGIESFLNIAGNPIQTTANSQDCFLKDIFSFEIQYARTVWLIIMPFLYIGTFLLFYLIGTYLKLTQSFNQSIIVTSILHTYIYFQPNMIGGLMQLLSFREISGYQWVKANVSTRFDSQLHYQWMLEFALPLLIILALVIPFFLFYFLFKNKQQFDQKRIRKILGYLYHEYKPLAYFWEILKIFQKEFIIIFLNFYEENIVLKGILVLLTSQAYSLLNAKHKPFQSSSLNMLDQSSTNVCTISFGLAIGLYIAQQQKNYELQIPFWIILSYYNIIFLLEIISRILIEYLKNFQKAFDDIIGKIGAIFPFLLRFDRAKQFIEKRVKQKQRIKYLISKLQNYLIPFAKNSLGYKKTLSKSYQRKQTLLYFENQLQGKFSDLDSEKQYLQNEKAQFFYLIKQKFQPRSNELQLQ